MSAIGDGRVTVAFDGSPLLGPLTGVGVAVQEMRRALDAHPGVSLLPYALSMRGDLLDGMVRLPLPAALAQRLWARMDWPRLDRRLRPAQVLHGTNYVVGPSRLPRVVSVYDCWFLRHPELAAPVVRRAGTILRRAVRSGAAVHASSEATAHQVRELLDTDRVAVVPLAALPRAEIAPAASAPPAFADLEGRRFVLAIGTIERRKNMPALLRAFAALASRAATEDVRLVLAGAMGDDQPGVDDALGALSTSVRSRILLAGRVDPAEKHWLLEHATALAYPSLDEGFGFPLLEAMEYGVPIVASTAGSIPEVAGRAALLVDPLDVDGLAAALGSVLEDPAVRAELLRHGRRRLDAFSWADTAAGLVELYRTVVQEGA